MIKQLIEYVVKYLVEAPESVNVQVFHDGNKCQIEVRVAHDDFKRVIGKDGVIVKAVRSLVYAVQGNNNQEVSLNVLQE